jgi:hypothetical protein
MTVTTVTSTNISHEPRATDISISYKCPVTTCIGLRRSACKNAVAITVSMDAQLVKKFPGFYGTGWFITVLTRARHLSVSWDHWIQSTSPNPISLRSILMFSSISCYELCDVAITIACKVCLLLNNASCELWCFITLWFSQLTDPLPLFPSFKLPN